MLRLAQLVVLALCAQRSIAVPSLEVQGADFVNPKTGNRFQIVGVAYQPGGSSGYNPGSDPLSDADSCMRDAALMQRLGVNAIRVYNVDPKISHDSCMSIFNAAGIYVALDVNSPLPNEALNSGEPWTTYDKDYLARTFGVVEAFKNFPNTLLFFSGNEVISNVAVGAIVPPYIRAVTRDLKNYIAKHSARKIPVGYSAADVRAVLYDSWNYLRCSTTGDSNDPSQIDLFALNSYSWCGNSDYHTSGYDGLTANFSETNVPVFFSEYGCNQPAPRIFTEVAALYGTNMTPVLSGGMIYEYVQEVNNFGLVNIFTNGSAQLLADFETLQKQYNKLDFKSLEGSKSTNTSVTPPDCKASLISSSGNFTSNFTLPDVAPGVTALISSGLSNPNIGNLITISDYTVKKTVLAINGTAMIGLAVKPVPDDESNTPSGVDDSGSSTTSSSAPATTTTKKGAGGRIEVSGLSAIIIGVLAVMLS